MAQIGRELEGEQRVIQPEVFAQALAHGRVGGQLQQARAFLRNAQLAGGAQHAVAFNAAQLAQLDAKGLAIFARRQLGAHQRARHFDARPRVGRAAHDLQRLAARIHLAHAQTVGIGVLLRRLDFGHHDLAERRRGRAGFFHLKAAHRQGVSQLLGIQRRVAELAQPGFGELHFRGLNVGYFNCAGFVFLAFARFFQWRRPAAPASGFALSSD